MRERRKERAKERERRGGKNEKGDRKKKDIRTHTPHTYTGIRIEVAPSCYEWAERTTGVAYRNWKNTRM